jgi:hypothetical protein
MTQDKLKELLDYNSKTGLFTWKVYKKCVTKGSLAGSIKNTGYLSIGIDYKIYSAHRLAWLYSYGVMPKSIDHINGNKLDNRLENLRECNLSENSKNVKITKRNTSGVKGVNFDKYHKKWRAELYSNGKRVYLKYFSNINEAEFDINSARKTFHKEFAREI